jgi:hypothetical protein
MSRPVASDLAGKTEGYDTNNGTKPNQRNAPKEAHRLKEDMKRFGLW